MQSRTQASITVIPATKPIEVPNSEETIRAGYARVSTKLESQQTSIDTQIMHYEHDYSQQIKKGTFYDIYSDEGISGTSTDKRADFNRMIQDALDGKFNQIVTKSLSRFARNTVDCLSTIRLLREHGVDIFFEKEQVHTISAKGDFLLTIYAAQAEMESYNISEIVKMGMRYRYQTGTFKMRACMGYQIDETGIITIHETQAQAVLLMAKLFLMGYSINGIRKELKKRGIKTALGKDEWSHGAIVGCLKNEKYVGDVLTNKTFKPDVMSKSRKNHGEVPQYYHRDHHPAIFSRMLRKEILEEFERRDNITSAGRGEKKRKGKYSSKYLFSNIMVCGECGNLYNHQHWAHRDKCVYRCTSRLKFGTRYCKESPSIEEQALQKAVMTALKFVFQEDSERLVQLEESYMKVVLEDVSVENIEDLTSTLNELKGESISQILELSSNESITDLDNYINKVKERQCEIQDQMRKLESAKIMHDVYHKRIHDLREATQNMTIHECVFDEKLVRLLVDKVIVISKGEIEIVLKNGLRLRQGIEKRARKPYTRKS